MGTLTFPYTLTAGQPENVNELNSNLTAIATVINGGLDTTNISASAAITGAQLAAAAAITASQLATAVQAAAGLNGASTRRGKCIVATEEARTNAAYGTLTTPDTVSSIVMPTDGLIFVGYRAMWKESVSGAARAALFLGANQLYTRTSAGVLAVQETSNSAAGADTYLPLGSFTGGIWGQSGNVAAVSDVTTGHVVGGPGGNQGFVAIHAAAGTYDISVQFKASSGSVTVKERKLWVWSHAFA